MSQNKWCGPQCCGPANIPAFNTCHPAEVKAKKAVDELKSYLNRRGITYLPKHVIDYYKSELETLQKELVENSCHVSCGGAHNILSAVTVKATDRLSEMQADIDLVSIKQEEQQTMEAFLPPNIPAANTSANQFVDIIHNKKILIGASAALVALTILYLVM